MYKKSAPAVKGKKPVSKERKPAGTRQSKPEFGERPTRPARATGTRTSKSEFGEKPTRTTSTRRTETKFGERPARPTRATGTRTSKPEFGENRSKPKFGDTNRPTRSKFIPKRRTTTKKATALDGVRLNKYIANAGICSRRDADTFIESGAVRINGVVCTQLGTRVMPSDKVDFGGETLTSEKKVYFLMNKPKGYITTTDDPQERKTVMHLIDGACKERIYPVGRLDRQTTGVLLFTNDGDMAKRLTHPSHGARKIYHVTLDKNITKGDLRDIAGGVELEDGFVHVDEVNVIAGTKDEIGIQLHSGMNRVVRRIFEKFGYNVVKLDRVLFAELTKKNLSRGHWRRLTDKEVDFLKMK